MKISIITVTYNHVSFIQECIDSVLSQNTTFNFEIIIGDDHSTDGTSEICEKFAKDYPEIVRVIKPDPDKKIYVNGNPTGRYNFYNCIRNSSGDFIAICEGDDYWSDTYKLQKQVDFLESNHDCIACHTWHKYAKLNNGIWTEYDAPKNNTGYLNAEKSNVRKILENKLRLKSRTLMFRNNIEFLDNLEKVPYGDIGMSILLGKYGEFGFIDEPTAVYRIHTNGVSNANKDKKHRMIEDRFNLLESIFYAKEVFGDKFSSELNLFYREKLSEIVLANRKSVRYLKVLNDRINRLCEKYELSKFTMKFMVLKVWLNPRKYVNHDK